MVRVVYRWRVAQRDFEEFMETWRITTNRIHESVAGAQGSFLLRSYDNESEVLTIAKWDSLESWKKFWGENNPKEMQVLRMLGERISVETFEEIEDYTR